ncbi:hypothetical protein F8M41_012238 [Gigaspora margarita]|nr:hypothetical protein F8M41_012238 [Gigaspora margarita]
MNQNNNVQPQNNQAQNLPATGRPQRAQNNVHLSINTPIDVQRYNDLVEGGNPFSGSQDSVIPLQNTEFPTVLFEGDNNVQPQNNQAQNLPTIGRPQRAQNNVHLSINTTINVQRYNDLVEGGNPFSGLQDSVMPLQNT